VGAVEEASSPRGPLCRRTVPFAANRDTAHFRRHTRMRTGHSSENHASRHRNRRRRSRCWCCNRRRRTLGRLETGARPGEVEGVERRCNRPRLRSHASGSPRVQVGSLHDADTRLPRGRSGAPHVSVASPPSPGRWARPASVGATRNRQRVRGRGCWASSRESTVAGDTRGACPARPYPRGRVDRRRGTREEALVSSAWTLRPHARVRE
jgi:hypothetical protein